MQPGWQQTCLHAIEQQMCVPVVCNEVHASCECSVQCKQERLSMTMSWLMPAKHMRTWMQNRKSGFAHASSVDVEHKSSGKQADLHYDALACIEGVTPFRHVCHA